MAISIEHPLAKRSLMKALDDVTHMGLSVDQDETHGFVSEDNMARRAYITAAVVGENRPAAKLFCYP